MEKHCRELVIWIGSTQTHCCWREYAASPLLLRYKVTEELVNPGGMAWRP